MVKWLCSQEQQIGIQATPPQETRIENGSDFIYLGWKETDWQGVIFCPQSK